MAVPRLLLIHRVFLPPPPSITKAVEKSLLQDRPEPMFLRFVKPRKRLKWEKKKKNQLVKHSNLLSVWQRGELAPWGCSRHSVPCSQLPPSRKSSQSPNERKHPEHYQKLSFLVHCIYLCGGKNNQHACTN